MRRFWTLGILLVALSAAYSYAQSQEQWFGDWVLSVTVDPFDDTESKLILAAPLNIAERDSVALSLACWDDGLNVILYWGRFFGGDRNDRVKVRYRFDDRPASEEQLWSMTSDSRAAWMPMGQIAEFVLAARVSNSILVRVVDPLDDDTIISETSLNGFAEALDAMLPCSQQITRSPSRPVNDDFINATVISGATGRVTGSNVNAVREANDPPSSRDPLGNVAVWWRWTAPESGSFVFDTSGSSFDTVLSIFTGSRLGANDFAVLATNDDASGLGTRSRVTITARSGTTYHIAVGGYDGATGSIVLNWARQQSGTTSSARSGASAGSASSLNPEEIANLLVRSVGGAINSSGCPSGLSARFCFYGTYRGNLSTASLAQGAIAAGLTGLREVRRNTVMRVTTVEYTTNEGTQLFFSYGNPGVPSSVMVMIP